MNLYLECYGGVSGDMLLGAILDTGIEVDYLKNELNKLNLEFEISVNEKNIAGIKTKKVDITQNTEQPLRKQKDIERIINENSLDRKVKDKSLEILDILAEAEANVHGTSKENIHFHEIGAVDTIVDIVGVVLLIEKINADVICSKINLGSGSVKIHHGNVPVPAPASAEIAKGMLTFSTDSEMELATPTGLAILKGIAKDCGDMPASTIRAVGYGAGSKSDDNNPNMVRAFVLEKPQEDVTEEIHANIDDCTGEILGHAMEKLFDAGALDVYFTPIQMKKQRPGVKLSVICNKEDTQKISKIIFRETTSTGLRINETKRKKLEQKIRKVNCYGDKVSVKVGYYEGELVNISPEYEDCKRIAQEKDIALKEVVQEASKKGFEKVNNKTQGHTY